jgi:hypothetical protein
MRSDVILLASLLSAFACRSQPIDGPQATTSEPAHSTTPSSAPWFVEPPELGPAVGGDAVPLARHLTARTSVPTQLTVHLDDGERVVHVTHPGLEEQHSVSVLGLPADASVAISVTARAADGATVDAELGTERTVGPPDPFPEIELLAHDPGRMEPGYTFGAIKSPGSTDYLVAFDDRMRLVWWWDDTGDWGDVRMLPDTGTLVGLWSDQPAAMTMEGQFVYRFAFDPAEPWEVPLPTGTAHHEAWPMPDGSVWTLCYGTALVDAFPTDYDDPTDLRGLPTLIADQCAVHLAPDGTVLQEVWMADLLDTERIGFDALAFTLAGYDWVHLNGLVPTDDGGLIVSSRHQDALVKVDAQGQLEWILGDPAGWGEAWLPYLLQPVGELSWPYHQHAPAIDAEGLVWVHDNHSHGRTPYTPEDDAEPQISRAVAYRVDPSAMTVEQVYSLQSTPWGPLFSPALGDADPLPTTGNVLVDYGFGDGEGPGGEEVLNEELGLGRKSVHLVEHDLQAPDDPPLAVRLSSDVEVLAEGWKMYRVERLPSLYGAQVQVTTEPSTNASR